MQGRVAAADVAAGRAADGYRCNTEWSGRRAAAAGSRSSATSTPPATSAPTTTPPPCSPPTRRPRRGTASASPSLDMSDPTQPRRTASLSSFAMLTPHESLLVNTRRGLLAAVSGNLVTEPGVARRLRRQPGLPHAGAEELDPVRRPRPRERLLPRRPDLLVVLARRRHPHGHRPHRPGAAEAGLRRQLGHPRRSRSATTAAGPTSPPAPASRATSCACGGKVDGLIVLDVSQVQDRVPNPQVTEVSRLTWDTVTIPQAALPMTIGGRRYLFEVDEFATTDDMRTTSNGPKVGAARIIDIADEKAPKVVSDLRLAGAPARRPASLADDPGATDVGAGLRRALLRAPEARRPGHRRLQLPRLGPARVRRPRPAGAQGGGVLRRARAAGRRRQQDLLEPGLRARAAARSGTPTPSAACGVVRLTNGAWPQAAVAAPHVGRAPRRQRAAGRDGRPRTRPPRAAGPPAATLPATGPALPLGLAAVGPAGRGRASPAAGRPWPDRCVRTGERCRTHLFGRSGGARAPRRDACPARRGRPGPRRSGASRRRRRCARMRSCCVDFGMTTTSCSRCQRTSTWAGVFPSREAIPVHDRVLERAAAQGAVALEHDAALAVALEHVDVEQQRAPLDLVDGGPHAGQRLEPVDLREASSC